MKQTQPLHQRFIAILLVLSVCMTVQSVSLVASPVTHSQSSRLAPTQVGDILATSLKYSTPHERIALQQTAPTATSTSSSSEPKAKSPFIALGLSLLIPGAGQMYNGDYVYGAGFLGVEAGTWILFSKYDSDGKERTQIYEDFNRAHWSEQRYTDYLWQVYGKRDDDSIQETEISHNLPSDPNAQQYFEQTGKYDQFSWGWDDTYLDTGLANLVYQVEWGTAASGFYNVPAAKGNNIPFSANRLTYETLRDDANRSFENRDRMYLVAALNRLLSGMHAFLVASSRKKATSTESSGGAFSRLEWTPSLETRHTFADTPVMQVRWRF